MDWDSHEEWQGCEGHRDNACRNSRSNGTGREQGGMSDRHRVVGWWCGVGRTDLEEIDATVAALFLGALHSLDAFSDGVFDVGACELAWWGRTEDAPFCGANDLFREVGGEGRSEVTLQDNGGGDCG
jgi:hypothetical protein